MKLNGKRGHVQLRKDLSVYIHLSFRGISQYWVRPERRLCSHVFALWIGALREETGQVNMVCT